jgi:hypothetical protein
MRKSRVARAFAHPTLRAGVMALLLLAPGQGLAQQTDSSDSLFLAPSLDGNPQAPPRFRSAPKENQRQPAQFGQLPSFSYRPAIGAGSTGFDSTNGARRKKARSTTKAKPAANPGATVLGISQQPDGTSTKTDPTQASSPSPPSSDVPPSPKLLQPAVASVLGRTRTPARPGAPPNSPDAETPTVATVPPLWRPLPELKPFDPLGAQVGAFNFFPAVEYVRGYDTNPRRLGVPPISGSWFNLYAPDLLLNSNWARHALTAEFHGTYTTFDTAHSQDRPTADGKVNGRIDVTNLSHIDLQGIFRMGTDYPGSPNIQADLARLPLYTTYGGYAGFGQRFNRFEVTVKSGAEHTDFQQSVFVNGQTDSNADRDYTQYTTTLRSAYDLTPGFRPFAEVSANKRVHELSVDRFGVDRDSVGYSAKIGTSVDLVRTVTGEIAVGYLNQMYIAPLPNLGGFLIDGTLAWFATPLTTAKLFASTTTTEFPLFLVSAVLTRQVGVELDHAFRRWLIGTLKFSLARDVYAGMLRVDNRYAASAALTYMFTRELALKGEYRQEWDRANVPGANYVASIWLLGLRLQR